MNQNVIFIVQIKKIIKLSTLAINKYIYIYIYIHMLQIKIRKYTIDKNLVKITIFYNYYYILHEYN